MKQSECLQVVMNFWWLKTMLLTKSFGDLAIHSQQLFFLSTNFVLWIFCCTEVNRKESPFPKGAGVLVWELNNKHRDQKSIKETFCFLISQYVSISDHHIAHCKLIQCYMSVISQWNRKQVYQSGGIMFSMW